VEAKARAAGNKPEASTGDDRDRFLRVRDPAEAVTDPATPPWWDPYSDQPYRLSGAHKQRLARPVLQEYLYTAATAVGALPALGWNYLAWRPQSTRPPANRFVGLGITPDSRHEGGLRELVAELGVEELLLRIPAWDLGRLDAYRRFAEGFPACRFLINVLQSRDSVRDRDRWRSGLDAVFRTFVPITSDFQIGNAINRTKWGCLHTGEYLDLLEDAESVRRDHPGVRLVGSSVIDFEPLATLRTLRNRRRYHLDAVSALLYVNRRGSPISHQYGMFDLARKLRLIAAIARTGNRATPRLWITETNWPLLDTRPWTPNSGHPRSTVDEATQARYLKHYYRIAWHSRLVERVYWWQLVAPGYGLVDHRGGTLRRLPSFAAFAGLLQGGLGGD